MKKNLCKIVILLTLGTSAYAQNYDRGNYNNSYHNAGQGNYVQDSPQYISHIDNSRNSLIQDFKVDISNFQTGQVIRFYADGEARARAVVKFNSAGKFTREIVLSETEPGRYTGSYTIRSVDELEAKTFNLSLTKAKIVSTATYRPMFVSSYERPERADRPERYEGAYGGYRNDRNNRNDNRYENRYNDSNVYKAGDYKNPDFGVITRIDVQDARPDQIDFGSAAVGAVVGGLLGNQVGGGSGKTAATVIGAIGGGALGNQVGKNIGTQGKIWNVSVQFQDGQTAVYQYPNDPQVAVGTSVRKESGGIARR